LRILIIALILFTLTACQFEASRVDASDYLSDSLQLSKVLQLQPSSQDTIWLIAAGDIVPATNHPVNILPPDSGKTLFNELSPYIKAADLAFGNFEGVVQDSGGQAKICYDKRFCFRFRIPEIYADRVKEAGFDLLNIACNHIDDFGQKGRLRTDSCLHAKGFKTAGLKHRPSIIFTKNGIRYGFAAFAPFYGCYGLRDSFALAEEVRRLKKKVDVVIVSLHSGAEGPSHRHLPKEDEIFLEFNRGNIYAAAHYCVDAGADLIIGTGPHVSRALELYKGKLIMYSIGNFCTYGFRMNEYTAYAPLMRVGFSQKGEFLAAQIIPIKQIERGLPRYDSTGLAIKHLQELTASDFPNTAIRIQDNGWIYPTDSSTAVDFYW
jgi:poly-gamma-glutamate capsule biosynthesis protein CapA/YwtB (metallophosphatase superfamily)